MKILNTVILMSLATIMISCSAVKPKDLDKDADLIKVDKEKPNSSYEVIGAVTGVDGSGCGSFGYEGSHERAMIDLQNKINELHGAYGQLTKVVKPHLDDGGGCFNNEYEIRAVAYRKLTKPKVVLHEESNEEEVFTKKMRELKSLLDDGVLTQKEYDGQKAKLLDLGFNTK